MSDTLILLVFATCIFGVIGFVLGYQLVKYLKGTVKIHIGSKMYHYGEKISGDIELHAKKHIDVQSIEVFLIAHRREKVHTDKGTKIKNVEIFRQSLQVQEKDALLPGVKRNYDFNMQIPNIHELPSDMQAMVDSPNSSLRTMQRMYRGFGYARNLRWSIKTLVHAEGIDLYSRESLEIQAPHHENNI